ncbi:protein tyrosine phosphatase family protein [Aquabacterium sp.]|uniref:protein tyrosine phosphatase family protein n=1 Tax=Aquabacterium sp. TaxID=1872578 RepID=UPI002BC9BFFF|nr:protein tyrosine phosphatase family protein [Aquabacterium sp.]HSW06333.1 protein tyrosine phosphatase family protein [Aquabacterium sp.]
MHQRSPSTGRRPLLAAALCSLLLQPLHGSAQERVLKAPNVVLISPRLITAGQPRADALALLAAQGFGAVIYLAPLTVSDAVPNEAGIVQGQGLAFVNIPIPFNKPTEADFEAFVAAMAAHAERKLLVHCQVNMRASSMVFLHRVIVGKEPPERAYEAVATVWSPDGTWKHFIVAMLKKHGVPFEPY